MAAWQTYTLGSLFTGESTQDVLCVAPNKWVICGTGGKVAYSTDDAKTWAASTGQDAISWTALASDGTTVVMVGDVADPANRIAVSSDFGATWTMIASAAALGVSWFGLCSVVAGTFVAFSDPTHIIKSTNSGVTWSATNVSALSGFVGSFRGGVANADGSLVVALTNAVPPEIAVSTDQGSTWAVGTSPTDCVGGVGTGSGSNQIQFSTVDDMFVIPGRTDSTNKPAIWKSADATAWASTIIDAALSGAPSPFMSAPAIGGFVAGIFGSDPVLFNISTDAGVSWTQEDSGFIIVGSFCYNGGWDDSTGTFVTPDSAPPSVVLVGTFSLTPSGTFAPETGPTSGGTVITLTGTGLSGVVQGDVLMDGIEALSVHAAPSGTSVTFVSPPHAVGPVDIEVVDVGVFEDAYTFVGVTSVIPRSGPVTGGQAVTIRGFGFNNAIGVRIGGVSVASFTIQSNTTITTTTPAHDSGGVLVEVVGVDTSADVLYTYVLALEKMPPIPWRVPVVESIDKVMRRAWIQWFETVKARIEAPVAVAPEQIIGAALTGVSDSNVTLTLSGSPSDALLRAVTLTLGWTGSLSTTRGGTGVSLITKGDLLYASENARWSALNIGAADTILKSDGSLPAWVAGEALTRVNDTNVTLTLGGDAATALVNAASLTLGWTGQLSLTRGGTNASLTAVNGGIVYSTATALAISAAGTSNDVLRSGGAGAPTFSSPAALTKTDDTNVTLTLGGSPSTALLAATSLTLGWTGTLSVARGGTGTGTTFTAGSVVFAGASGVFSQDNANFFWDDTNNRLGIGGTTSPSAKVDIRGTSGLTSLQIIQGGEGANDGILFASPAIGSSFRIYVDGGTNIGQMSRGTTPVLTFSADFKVGVGTTTTPTAGLHLQAGTTLTAPLKFTSGSLLTSAAAGAVEFLTDDYYATITTGAARKGIVLNDGTSLTSGRVPFATTNGRLTDDADLTFATDTLTTTKLAVTNKVTSYNSVTTAGWGVPAIYGSGRSTAQTAAVATVATYTVGAADGSFEVLANVLVTTSTTHNFTCAVDYTDEGNTARTLTLSFTLVAGGALVTAIDNANGAVPYMGVPQRIRAKAATAITVKTVGTFTTLVYNVEGSIIQIA